MDPEEQELVRQCLSADQDACARLVDTYARVVGTVIWRATGQAAAVEDLSQEVFFKVFRGLARFDGRAKLSTWVYTIAHRVALDYRRQAGRGLTEHSPASDDDPVPVVEHAAASGPDPEASAIQRELEGLMRGELARLPDKYRLPLAYAVDGLDYETIGAMIGTPAGTVKTLVFRAREMLKERMRVYGA